MKKNLPAKVVNKKIILWVDVETLIFPWCHRSRLSLTFFSLFPQTVWWVKASFWTSQKSNGSRPRTTNASPTTEWLHPINTKSKLLSTVSICGERERECEWERPHLITLKIIYNPSVHIIYVFHSIKKQCFFRHSCICSEYNSVGRGTGPQQMDLDWSRSWLVTALLLLYCMLSDPPMITDMKNMPAHLGKTAILRCEAMAVPPAAFEWYRDEHRWTSVPDTFVFKDRNDRRGEV